MKFTYYREWIAVVRCLLRNEPNSKILLLALLDWESQDEPQNAYKEGLTPKKYADMLILERKEMENATG